MLTPHALPTACTLLTNAQGRGDAQAQQVLVQQEERQEEAVVGPETGNGPAAPAGEDGHQPAAVYDDHEVHALPNHIHGHQEADLGWQSGEEMRMKDGRSWWKGPSWSCLQAASGLAGWLRGPQAARGSQAGWEQSALCLSALGFHTQSGSLQPKPMAAHTTLLEGWRGWTCLHRAGVNLRLGAESRL